MAEVFLLLLIAALIQPARGAFVHPGLLHTQSDLDRMKAKVAANARPWSDSWNRLIANSHASLGYAPNPPGVLIRGSSPVGPENYSRAYNDAAAAYATALRYWITGDTNYANKSVQILNAWSSTCTNLTGDSNQSLAAGLYGYQFANAAELMRGYSGWGSSNFVQFQKFMTNVFYPRNKDFLNRHHDTCITHYWANWDLCNLASALAIGVLCDDTNIYHHAINYFLTSQGNGASAQAVYFVHPGHLGQWQESGRDQGHNCLGPALLGALCEMAWNQGLDLYGYDNNRFLAGAEYVARYNLFNRVPYITYNNCEGEIQPGISPAGRGDIRPAWELIYNHYVNRKGLAAPYVAQYAALLRPEGGGGNYGPNSGGYDQLGYGTLTATLDPISSGAIPSGLTVAVVGRRAVLSWWGSAYATSYNIKRATNSGGPYTPLANGVTINCVTNFGLVKGVTYHYVVSAVGPNGESAHSAEISASANDRLAGTIIGSPGSYQGLGATIVNVFDDGLRNFYDAANGSGDWAGLDLGEGHVINQVRYCPRSGFASRMVGGTFQGANVADFSNGVVTLFTIATAPPSGVLTSQAINNPGAFRYVRYRGPTGGSCNVAEVQFHGMASAPAAPAAPTGLTATATNGQVALSWTTPATATSLNVKRATNSGGPYTTIAPGVTITSHTDTTAAYGVTYYYVVSASNDLSESTNSLEASATLYINLAPTLIPGGAGWRYFDKTNDLGASWRSNSFSDVTWSNGAARLGYGSDGEVTKVASNRQWTTYFRRQFYVPNPTNVTALNARLTRDDAAVIYLNGAEVWRDTNITSGTITSTTPALVALGGADETNWLTLNLQPSTLDLLLPGWNLLAAEVHNQSLTSSDLGFDFELAGEAVLNAPPALTITDRGDTLDLAGPAEAGYFVLYSASNLTPPVLWTYATNTPVLSNGVWNLNLPAASDGIRFFRLQAE